MSGARFKKPGVFLILILARPLRIPRPLVRPGDKETRLKYNVAASPLQWTGAYHCLYQHKPIGFLASPSDLAELGAAVKNYTPDYILILLDFEVEISSMTSDTTEHSHHLLVNQEVRGQNFAFV
jgi:hypothetical protein